MADEGKFFHESMQDIDSVRSFLESLQEGLQKGRIVLGSEQEEFTLNPPDVFTFSIKAKKEGGASKLQLKISWEEKPSRVEPGSRHLTIFS
jgi:amphi-Trp domain-containing protein